MNIPEQLKFEDNFEKIVVGALNEVGVQSVQARYSEEITDQVIQVYFENDGNLDEAVSMVGDYRKYNAYQGSMAFVVSSNRAKIKNHPDKLALVRLSMMPEHEYLNNDFYQILEVREESATTDVDESSNSDITYLSFSIKYFLK
jgi:hypothetical protein